MEKGEINKLCRQVSIDSPNLLKGDCVYNAIVPVADCPPKGARILVVYAGACYRRQREISNTSISSLNSDHLAREISDISVTAAALAQMQASGTWGRENSISTSPAHCGYRDAALFPGFEVAGVIESLGSELKSDCGFIVGQRVILYPYEGIPAGYSELFVVPELKYLIPVPDEVELSVAAMLPTGALLAMSSILSAHKIIDNLHKKRNDAGKPVKLLIVGTGGLALWAVRIAAQHFYHKDSKEKVEITVASLRDEGLALAKHEFEK